MKNLTKTTYLSIAGVLFTSLLVTNLCRANEIQASFERELNHTSVSTSEISLSRKNDLPVQNAVNRTVWTKKQDQVRESFKRDLNHKTVTHNTTGKRKVDPIATLIRNFLSTY